MDDDVKTNEKKRVGAYIRVSTAEQAKDGFGLEMQLRDIRRKVALHKEDGWTFDEEKRLFRDEGRSGATDKRPGFQLLMKCVHNKEIDVLIVWKIDRLFRSMRFLLETVDDIYQHDVDFISIKDSKFDSTAVGKLIFHLFAALAEFERDLIIQRTGEGRMESAEEGNYVGGNVPYGYVVVEERINGKRNSRTLQIEEDDAKWVRKMYAWFVECDYSCDKIAEMLTMMGVLSNSDKKKYKPGKKRRKANPKGFWHTSTIRKILQREVYTGKYYYNKKGKGKDGKEALKPKKEWVEFSCPRIIDDETFKKAQKKFEISKKRSNSAKNVYLLSGKVKCGKCGSTYTGYLSSKKTKGYRCGKNNKTKAKEKCKAREISEKILGDAVWDYVLKFLLNPNKVFNEYHRELQRNSVYQGLVDEKKSLEAALKLNKEARGRVREAFRRGSYTQDELDEELAIIDDEKAKIKKTLEEVDAQLNTEEAKEEKVKSVKALKEQYDAKLKRLSYEDKRDVLQEIVDHVLVDGEDIKVVLKVPKAMQSELNKSKNLCGATGQD